MEISFKKLKSIGQNVYLSTPLLHWSARCLSQGPCLLHLCISAPNTMPELKNKPFTTQGMLVGSVGYGPPG